MAILPVGISGEAAAYEIERSLRFNSADSTSLNRTPGSASNRKTWTWSGWVKRCEISDTERVFFSAGADANNFTALEWINSKLYLQNYTSGVQTITNTTAVFRDASAWYHIVLAIDTTQATSANRAKIYVNGVQQAGFSGSPFSLNQEFWINYTYSHRIGARQLSSADAFSNQYMAEVHFIDGSALDPTSFGEYNSETGVWQPKAYSGARGTNGFYLNFSDNSGVTSTTLGKDQAGSNNWTPNNFSVTAGAGNDSLVDTPTNYGEDTGVGGEVRGNYCTWNPLDKNTNLNTVNGNLDVSVSNGAWIAAGSTAALAGKIYAETTWTTAGNGFSAQFGLRQSDLSNISAVNPTDTATAWSAYWDSAGTRGTRTNSSITNNVGSAAVNDVYQVAFDADTGNLWLGYNNNWHGGGNPSTGTSPTYSGLTNAAGYRFFCATNFGTTTGVFVSNFGQRPFAYTAPSGFKALCTQNLPEPTIVDGGEYFNTVLYTADTAGGKTISGVGFQPDFLWVKNRDNVESHHFVDSVRGSDAFLFSNRTDAELNAPYADIDPSAFNLTFNSDGFAISDTDYNQGEMYFNGRPYVAWNWKANGAGVSNTDGSITSTVSANTTSGISICTYTGNATAGATVGHGLGVAPAMIIVKDRDGTYDWYVYHDALAVTNVLRLSDTSAAYADQQFNQQDPTSSIFYLGNNVASNTSGHRYVAYCFAAIPSFSAMGSYLGNGSADGPFVFLNFRPAWIMIKNVEQAGGQWFIYDDARETYNPNNSSLFAESLQAETANNSALDIDFLSNGWKIRNTGSGFNNSGIKYIYMAFAENPFKYSLAR
jgi:hypothetical protein